MKIDPKDIHHLIYFSSLFIGDSQSMIVESAMLGTPSIRYNSFVGKISILNELEDKYHLTSGIYSDNPDCLLEKTKQLLSTHQLKEVYNKRRLHMLSEKIDVTAFLVWFVENYPGSVKTMKEHPEYQIRFKINFGVSEGLRRKAEGSRQKDSKEIPSALRPQPSAL